MARPLPEAHGPQQLPYELINNVADLLSRPDFENFRLSSKKIAGCTRAQLALAHFNGLPWRQDGARLHSLSLIPSCARRIRSVKFNMARIEDEAVDDAMMQIQDPLQLQEQWGPYLSTQGQATAPVKLPLDLVVPALMRLPNLDTLCLTWVECPWREYVPIADVFLDEFSLHSAGSEVIETQQAILEALRTRNVPLKSLTLEPSMHAKLVMPSSLDEKVATVFGSITQLRLSLNYNVRYFKPDRLDFFISFMPNIRHLVLHSLPVDNGPGDVDFFIKKRLEHLESVEFSCLEFNFVSLAGFFLEHGPTLKHIKLQTLYGWCDPFDQVELDWDLMFQLMGDKTPKLESIRVTGTFSDNVGWRQMFYSDDDPHAEVYRQSRAAEESSRLEKYIVEGGEYPQPRWRI